MQLDQGGVFTNLEVDDQVAGGQCGGTDTEWF